MTAEEHFGIPFKVKGTSDWFKLYSCEPEAPFKGNVHLQKSKFDFPASCTRTEHHLNIQMLRFISFLFLGSPEAVSLRHNCCDNSNSERIYNEGALWAQLNHIHRESFIRSR